MVHIKAREYVHDFSVRFFGVFFKVQLHCMCFFLKKVASIVSYMGKTKVALGREENCQKKSGKRKRNAVVFGEEY